MKIDSAAAPFVAIAAVPALLCGVLGQALVCLALLALPLAVALFFRDPERTPPPGPHLVLSPADGVVMHAGPAVAGQAPAGEWLQVTVFLSLLDVHINRTPVAGTMRKVEYVPGTFRAAFRPESAGNEHSELWIDHDGVLVVTRQVVGVLARRVVCRVRPGDVVGPGDRIGLMKFGSRMDVFVPVSASLTVATGVRVRGGETVIAHLGPSAA